MPLIIICGTPVSGKTIRAKELKEFFENNYRKHVEIISEDQTIVKLGYDKNSTYLDSQKEKRVRGYLKSEVIRLIGKDNVVILDGSNYIKGYRYELYCASKASKSTQCTIYTIRNQQEAWDDNVLRQEVELKPNDTYDLNNQPYTEEVFNALTKLRFEEPRSSDRWDSPLFTVQPSSALDVEGVYRALFETKPPPPNMSTQNEKGRPLSKQETKTLVQLIESSKVINKKPTDAATNKLKLEEWKKITQEFNSTAIWRRSPQQLRLKWENLKKSSRKRSMRISINDCQSDSNQEYIPPDDILDRVANILVRPGDEAETDAAPNPPDSEPPNVVEEYVQEHDRVQEPIVELDIEITPELETRKRKFTQTQNDWRAARDRAITDYYTTKKRYLEAKMENIVLENKKLKLELEKLRLEKELETLRSTSEMSC